MTTSDFYTHILVNDDQAGPYQRMSIQSSDRVVKGYRWCLEMASFIMPALPASVNVRAEFAERTAREQLARMVSNRQDYKAMKSRSMESCETEKGFDTAAPHLVSRTYLTQSWKYVRRMLRNEVPAELKFELTANTMPRHVWVTEFSLPDDLASSDPCERRVRAHVVVDPTSGPDVDSSIVSHVPGIFIIAGPGEYGKEPTLALNVLANDTTTYRPKVRGWDDYYVCAVQDNLGENEGRAKRLSID